MWINKTASHADAQHYFKSQEKWSPVCGPARGDRKHHRNRQTLRVSRPIKRDPILPKFADDEVAELRRRRMRVCRSASGGHPACGHVEEYQERLDFELDIIEGMGFPGYFLIVADFINGPRTMASPLGPGRGSGAGQLVAYALTSHGP